MNLSRRVIKAAQVRFDGAETDVTRAAWLPPEPVAVGGGGAAVTPAQTYNPDEVKQALGPGGALEMVLKAKEEGKIRHIGFRPTP